MTPTRKFVGLTRLAIGATSMAAPDLAMKAFGIDPARSNGFVSRLFASREALLAIALLGAAEEDLQKVATVGAVIDGLDAASALIEYRAGRLSTWAAISGGAGAVLFSALGILIARDAQPAAVAEGAGR